MMTLDSAQRSDCMNECQRIRMVVLQPTSKCNLDCRYCYVKDRADPTVMDGATLVAALTASFESPLVRDEVELLWHAGEPLAAGISFYDKAFRLVELLKPNDLTVTQSIQTNATLMSPRWADLFRANDVCVGVSLDGPAHLHDSQRITRSGRGSHAATVRGIKLLQDAGLPVGAVCVVTRESLSHADEIFDEFVGLGVRSIGLNVEEVEGMNTRSSLRRCDDGRYRAFLTKLWRRWRADPGVLEIREFDHTLKVFENAQRDLDWHRVPDDSVGFRIVTITKTGDVSTYSPELAGTARFRLGNINVDSLASMIVGDVYTAQRNEVEVGRGRCARECAYYRLCGGGYISNRFFEHGTFAATETVTCKLHRQSLVEVLLSELEAEAPTPTSGALN